MIKPKNVGKKGHLPKQRANPAFYETGEAEKARKINMVSYRVASYGLNLPCWMNMDEEKLKKVCKDLLEAMK